MAGWLDNLQPGYSPAGIFVFDRLNTEVSN